MVKYSAENIRIDIGPIDKIQGQPSFSSLWHLHAQLIAGTKRIKNNDHPTNGHSGYIMYWQEYALLSTKEWMNAPDMEYFSKYQRTPSTIQNRESERNDGKSPRMTRHPGKI